jgi:hypothetical protein
MEQTLAAAASVDDWLLQMRQIVENSANKSSKFRDNYTAQALWFSDRDSDTK